MSRKKPVPAPRPRTPPPAPPPAPVDPVAADRWVRDGALHESSQAAEVEVVVAPPRGHRPEPSPAVPSRPGTAGESRALYERGPQSIAVGRLNLARGVQQTPAHDARDYPRRDTAAAPDAPAEDPPRDEPPADTPRPPGRALVKRASGRAQVKLTVYIDADTSEALRAYCEREGRQQSRVVDNALRAYLDARPDLADRT